MGPGPEPGLEPMGPWDPGGHHYHTYCLSSSVLKIDLFSMAFQELQWLVRPSAILSSTHLSSSTAFPDKLFLVGGQKGTGPHSGSGKPCFSRHGRESVSALCQSEGALPAGPSPLRQVGNKWLEGGLRARRKEKG